jgi:hypothetical protein
MTRYGTSRKLAAMLAAIGWLAMFACVALAMVMGTRLARTEMLLTLLIPMCAGFAGGLVLVVLGHLARAVFDIADCVADPGRARIANETGPESDPDPQGGHAG